MLDVGRTVLWIIGDHVAGTNTIVSVNVRDDYVDESVSSKAEWIITSYNGVANKMA